MKSIITLVIIFSLLSCSKNNNTYQVSNNYPKDLLSQCRDQVKSVLKVAIIGEGEEDPYYPIFEKDEKKAIQILDNYKPNLLSILGPKNLPRKIYENALIEGAERIKFLNVGEECDYLLEEFRFLEGLVYAVSVNNWNFQTKELAKNKIKLFFKRILQDESLTLVGSLVGLSLLKQSSDLNVLYGEHKQLLKDLQKDAENLRENVSKVFKAYKSSENDSVSIKVFGHEVFLVSLIRERLIKLFSTIDSDLLKK